MRILPINNTRYKYNPKLQERKSPTLVFKSGINPLQKKTLTIAAQSLIRELKLIAKLDGVSVENFDNFIKRIDSGNFQVFKNITLSLLGVDRLAHLFTPGNTDNYSANKILDYVNDDNRKFAQAYTELGGRNFKLLENPSKVLNDEFANFDFSDYSINTVDMIIPFINESNVKILQTMINTYKLDKNELYNYVQKLHLYSKEELTNVENNIDKGFAKYFTEVAQDKNHPLRKALTTKDFQKRCQDFYLHFNYISDKRDILFDYLRFPLESKQNIEKTFRQMGSIMGKISNNRTRGYGNPDDEHKYKLFFNMQLDNLMGILFYTDKETIFHLYDKKEELFLDYLRDMKYLTKDDTALLSDIIKHGKRLNANNEYADISAKEKLYALQLINQNRNILAKTVGELNLRQSLKPIDSGFFVDFKEIEFNVRNKVLNQYGFSDEEISNLDPKNLDWDSDWMHLLILKNSDKRFKTIVREASTGGFETYIFSPDNDYGRANIETKQHFEHSFLNYNTWLKGIEPENFEIDENKLTISLWNRRPQQCLFDGSHTTCCTSLNGTQGDSMAEYILSTMFNIFEIKDDKNNVVAMSRVFLINEHDPVLMIDNIEINNTFKKKLGCYKNLNSLMENIFDYQRKFAKELYTKHPMQIYFAKDNFKLFDSDMLDYQKDMWYVFETIGTPVDKTTYCNATAGSFSSLPRKMITAYNITQKIQD